MTAVVVVVVAVLMLRMIFKECGDKVADFFALPEPDGAEDL
jgi:hypothetical protein